jgi:acyl-CoA synthetase (NDP forming)
MSENQILKQALREKRTLLTEIESKELLKEAGIPVVETKLAKTKQEAIALSKIIGFPVALKIASPDITHKSDSGGVKLALTTSAEVGNAYDEILSAIKQKFPEAKIQGISVQKMAQTGIEVIIGMSKDAQFGPVVMFGLGGIFVELLKDVSFRIVPITRKDAGEMIKEIKGYQILKGYRGQEPADIPSLEQIIVKVSELAEKNPQIKELDLNPVFAYKNGAVAIDARVILETSAEG